MNGEKQSMLIYGDPAPSSLSKREILEFIVNSLKSKIKYDPSIHNLKDIVVESNNL